MLSPLTAKGNRIGLALVGTVLTAGGLYSLGQSQDVWSAGSAHDRLLTAAESRWAAHHTWFWIAVAVVAVLVTLACLRWLVVQARRAGTGSLRLEADRTHGGTEMASSVVTDAVEGEIGGYPDVRHVQAVLTGSADEPRLRLTVKTAEQADLDGLRARIHAEALPRLRQALEADRLGVYLRMVLDTGGRDRVLS